MQILSKVFEAYTYISPITVQLVHDIDSEGTGEVCHDAVMEIGYV